MPVFRALFLAATADCFLHGPGKKEEKALASLVCILSAFLDDQAAYVFAELLWALVFLRAHLARPASAAAAEPAGSAPVSAAPEAATEAPDAEFPSAFKAMIDDSKAQLIKNVEDPKTTSDGQTWKLSSDKNGVKVWWAPYSGKSFLRYRAEFTAYGPRDGIYAELFDYAKRCKRTGGWDDALDWGNVLKEFGNGYRLVEYATTPQYGGRISSRGFVDGRIIADREDGGLVVAGVALDGAKFPHLMPPKRDGVERGTSYPGGGCVLEPVTKDGDIKGTPREWRITLVAAVDIGGSIPQWMTNSATASVLQSSSEGTKAHLAKCFPKA